MSEALWGFIGALVGAIAATGETMWVQWMQNRAAIRAQRLQIERGLGHWVPHLHFSLAPHRPGDRR
jgi:hypothetical protein